MVQQDLIILFRWSHGATFFLLGEREVALETWKGTRYPSSELLHQDHNEPCRSLCCAWLVGRTPRIGWLLLVVYWCLLYHLESRWRNSHVLVYHGPLLIHLLGVASHLLSIQCTFCVAPCLLWLLWCFVLVCWWLSLVLGVCDTCGILRLAFLLHNTAVDSNTGHNKHNAEQGISIALLSTLLTFPYWLANLIKIPI